MGGLRSGIRPGGAAAAVDRRRRSAASRLDAPAWLGRVQHSAGRTSCSKVAGMGQASVPETLKEPTRSARCTSTTDPRSPPDDDHAPGSRPTVGPSARHLPCRNCGPFRKVGLPGPHRGQLNADGKPVRSWPTGGLGHACGLRAADVIGGHPPRRGRTERAQTPCHRQRNAQRSRPFGPLPAASAIPCAASAPRGLVAPIIRGERSRVPPTAMA